MPAGNTQKECLDDCSNGVLKIGDQLDGQQRKGAFVLLTQKAGDGHLFFPEFREQINGISPVGVNFLIAITMAADGTLGTNVGHKIDWMGKEGFFVFPNSLEFVNVWKLNFSAALPTRGHHGFLKPFGLSPCRAWLFYRGQFLSSLFQPLPYHRFVNFVNTPKKIYSSVRLSTLHRAKVVDVDPDDNKFIECAVTSKAGYIVSGDKHLLNLKNYQGIQIIKAATFLDIFTISN